MDQRGAWRVLCRLGRGLSGAVRCLLGAHLSVHAGLVARWTKSEKPNGFRREEAAKGYARRRETFGRASRSAKRLSDTEWPFAGAGSEAAVSVAFCAFEASTGRSRCSISQRATMALAFSWSHWSSREEISLRRLAA